MSQAITLTDRTGKLKQLREKGQVPAVVYSSRIESVLVAAEEKQILSVLKRNPHALLQVELPEYGKQPVMIHQVQRDALTGRILHVDFLQVNMKEKIDTPVIVHFTGEPKGVKEGGILQAETHEVTVRCLPSKLPGALEADISHLGIGEHISVGDLKLPKDVELVSDPESILVTILAVQKIDESLLPSAEETVSEAEAAGTKESVRS